jgi:hypothetical protein
MGLVCSRRMRRLRSLGLQSEVFFAFAALFGCAFVALAFPCFLSGLLALPLCGAAPTSLCRRKEK